MNLSLKRILSFVLALVMVVGMLPANVLSVKTSAAEVDSATKTIRNEGTTISEADLLAAIKGITGYSFTDVYQEAGNKYLAPAGKNGYVLQLASSTQNINGAGDVTGMADGKNYSVYYYTRSGSRGSYVWTKNTMTFTYEVYQTLTVDVTNAEVPAGSGVKITYIYDGATKTETKADGEKVRVDWGTTPTFEGVPVDGYTVPNAPTLSVATPVKANGTISINYKADVRYDVTIQENIPEGGNVNVSPNPVGQGEKLTITITPNSGNGYAYYVESVAVNGANQTVSYNNGVATVVVTNVQAIPNVVVNYGKRELTVSGDLTIEVNGHSTDTKILDIQKNIIEAILGSNYTNVSDYEIYAMIQIVDEKYRDISDVNKLKDLTDSLAWAGVEFWLEVPGADENPTTEKIQIVQKASADGKMPAVTLTDVVIFVTEYRKPAELGMSSLYDEDGDGYYEYNDFAAFEADVKDKFYAYDMNNNPIDRSAAGVTLSITPGEPLVDGTYTVTVNIQNAGETWLVPKTGITVTLENIKVQTYTVTWYDEDGKTVLDQQTLPYGSTPVYAGGTPTKQGDAQYSWTFGSWELLTTETIADNGTITGNVSYKAVYNSSVNEYTVTFVDGNGNTLQSGKVAYGTVPTYTGATPTKDSTNTQNFTFKGWDKEISAVTGEVTYTAQFQASTRYYTVTFKDYNGKVLGTSTVEYGKAATAPADPTRAADKTYTYAFAGWDKAFDSITKDDMVVKATYTATYIDYTITWVYNGKTVTETYHYGDKIKVPAATDYVVGNTTYTFQGWDANGNGEAEVGETLPATVTENTTYKAIYTDLTVWDVTVKFANGTDDATGKVENGKTYTLPANPTKKGYRFMGWKDQDGNTVSGTIEITENTTITAQWAELFTVTWMNDGKVYKTETDKYIAGETPVAPADPTKAADAQYTYTFAGWTPTIDAITGDTTYTATYSKSVNSYTVTFVDENGNKLYEQTLEYGETPVYGGATPSKQYYSYSWSPAITTVTGNATYKLVWTPNTDANNNGIADELEKVTIKVFSLENAETQEIGFGTVVVQRIINGEVVSEFTVTGEYINDRHPNPNSNQYWINGYYTMDVLVDTANGEQLKVIATPDRSQIKNGYASRVSNIWMNNYTNLSVSEGDGVMSATVTPNGGDTIGVHFYREELNAKNGTVYINKYYTDKSDKAALATLRTDILTAAGLGTDSKFTVIANVGVQSLGDWATWDVEVLDGAAKVIHGTEWLWNDTYLANELNKGSFSFVIKDTSTGISKTVTMTLEDSRAVLSNTELTVSQQKDLGYMTNDNILADIKAVVGDLALGTPSISAGSLPANAGDLTSVTYSVKFDGDANLRPATITITYEKVYKAYNDCTVSADSSLTANGSMTINGGSNATVPGNSDVTITVKPSSNKIVEKVFVNGVEYPITYSNQSATITFKSNGATAADKYVISAEYSDKYLNLKNGTIVYCVDDKDHTYDLQKLVFDAIFGGSCAPMNKDNVKLEFAYAHTEVLGQQIALWADVSKDPTINIDGISHKFGEDGSEIIKLTYSDDKYGEFKQEIDLNVFDSCYNVTVGVKTETNGANATIKTQFNQDDRAYLGVGYFKAGTTLTVTLTPDGELLNVLKQMYNGTYADKMAYIKNVVVTDKNGNVVEAELNRDIGKLSLEGILAGVNPLLYNAAVTFNLEADEQYTITVEYGILELNVANGTVQLPMYHGGNDYAAKVPSADELVDAILGEEYADNFLATYGGAFTVEFTDAVLHNEWTAVSDAELLKLSDGAKITVRITWKADEESNKTYYPVANTAVVTLVDLRTPTSVQGEVPSKQVNFISEDKLIAELKEAMGLGILADGSALNVNYTVTYTLKGNETDGFFADVTVTYGGSAEYKPTSKTFVNVPVANRPDDATIKVTIQNASDVVTNNDGKIQALDPSTGIYTVIGNGTYIFQFTPAVGYAIESVTINGVKAELAYAKQSATFSVVLDEKVHYEVIVKTVPSEWVLEDEPTYDFATGVMNPDNGDIVESVTKYPTDIDFEKVVLEYLARTEGKVTVSLPNIDLGFTVIELGTFDVDLGELWLNPEESVDAVSEDQLDKILDKLLDDVIFKVSSGELAATNALTYIQDYIKNLPLGIHAFGANGDGSTETIRFRYEDDKYLLAEVVTDVTIHDYRIATEIQANDCEVTFGYSLEQLLAAAGAGVFADGVKIDGLEINTNDLYLHAGEQTITLYFAGDVNYQPSKVTIHVTVKKASASVNYDSQFITYGDSYDFGLTVLPVTMPDGTTAKIDLIEFMIGLDMHKLLDVDIEDKDVGINEAIAYIQLRLPESIRNLPLVGQYLQGEFTLGEFTDLINSLSDVLGIDEDSLGVLNQVVEAITGITDNLEIKIIIKDKELHPTNIGVYIAGAVTVDADFENAYTADYLIIAPKTYEAELDWDYTDGNGIMTLPAYQNTYKDLMGAHVVENEVMTGDRLATANGHVKYLILGINDETSEFLTTDIYGNIKANIWTSNDAITDNGAYVQIAYMLNWGNEIYYAMPIVRSFMIVPTVADVVFVDKNGNENNDQIFEFNNGPHSMNVQVTVDGTVVTPAEGELKFYYVGVQTNGKAYQSFEAPEQAGVYTVMVTYTGFDENGNLIAAGAAVGVMAIEPTKSTIDVTGDTVIYDGNGHTANVVTGSAAGSLKPDFTLISGGAWITGDVNEVGVDAFYGNVNIDFPKWFDAVLAEYEFTEGVDSAYLTRFFTAYRNEMVAKVNQIAEKVGVTVTVEQLNAYIDELLAVLAKMPSDVVLTFNDNVTYTEPGAYLYYGIVTDSDHYPSTDTGLLVIEKKDMSFELIDTTVTWDGDGHMTDVANPSGADFITIVVDRQNNAVSIVLDEDAQFLLNKLAEILNVEFDGNVQLSNIVDNYNGAEIASAIVELIDGLQQYEISEEVAQVLAAVKAVLVNLPVNGTVELNGLLPSKVGQYEIYAVSYAQHYKATASKAVLEIVPVRVEVVLDNNSKVYGDADPELTYKVNYYDHLDNLLADSGAANVIVSREPGEDVGFYAITAKIELPEGYELIAEPEDAQFEITPAELTVTMDDITIHIGDKIPELTWVIEGLVNGDTAADITVNAAHNGNNAVVGTYTITATAENGNYIITVVDATLTVEDHKYEAVVTAPNCTEQGYTTHTCSVCGDSYVDSYVDELGHKDENFDHVCDNGCDVFQGTCEDADLDHDCDYGCDKVYGTHEDTDLDHACDYGCSETIGTCEDADLDHDCDYGCDKVYGTHEDTDLDHGCDYGCSEKIGTCEDKDLDHDCDYGCDKVYGTHEDTDLDHACDYGCSESIGTCEDKDLDHNCDYGCDKVFGTCEDADKDHDCDYGCDKVYGTHEDTDLDHACDYGCSETIGTCEDADLDHDCDYGCDKVYGTHEDTDLNHTCDYGCSEKIGDHSDADLDHGCDYGCSESIGTCEDADLDHDCDYGCDKVYGDHEDTDLDHACDYGCSEKIGDHSDANLDHGCDYGCSESIGTCEDADLDHDCDYGCDKVYGTHEDADLDHACDYGCSEKIGDHTDADLDHGCDYGCSESIGICGDADHDHDCDYGCDKVYGDHADSATDGDHICDYCENGEILEDCTGNDAVIENVVGPNTTDAGHWDEVIYCSVCGKELSRETIVAKTVLTIDGVHYSSFAEAVNFLNSDVAHDIKLYDNIEEATVPVIFFTWKNGHGSTELTIDLNGYNFHVKSVTAKSGMKVNIVDTAGTGSFKLVGTILGEAGNTISIAENVKFDGTIQMNNTKSNPGTIILGEEIFVGTNGVFSIDQNYTAYLHLGLDHPEMNVLLNVGTLTLNRDYTIQAGQKFTIGASGVINIPENVTLTIDADAAFEVLSNKNGAGNITGEGTVVVNTVEHLNTVLKTNVANIKLGCDIATDIEVDRDVNIDLNGKTLTGNVHVTAGTLTVVDSTVDESAKNYVEAGTITGAITGNAVLYAGNYNYDVKDLCADGYISVEGAKADGVWTVMKGKLVVDNVPYDTWAEATTDIKNGCDTVVLYADIIENSTVQQFKSGDKLTVDLNGHTLSIKSMMHTGRTEVNVVDSSANSTGKLTNAWIQMAGYDDKFILAPDVEFDGSIQSNNQTTSTGNPSTFFIIGDEIVIGENGIFETGKQSSVVSVRLADDMMKLTLVSGDLVMKKNMTTLAGQTITLNKGTVLTIEATLTIDANTTIVANGTVNGTGTIVVSTAEHLDIVLDTQVENVKLADDVTGDVVADGETTLDLNGMTIDGAMTVNGKLTIKDSTVDPETKEEFLAAGKVTGMITVNGELELYAGTYNAGMFTPATVTKHCADGYVANKNADGTWTIMTVEVSDYVCWNVDTGVYYTTASAGLAAAMNGQTVELLKGTKDAPLNDVILMVPAGVTFDLNGYYITAGNVFSFGHVIDNDGTTEGDGLGGIIISNDRTKAFVQLQPDNKYLPLYDAQNGCYRFFAYQLQVLTHKSSEDAVQFRFRLRLSTAEAYKLLADTANSGVELAFDLSWTGMNSGGVTYVLRGDLLAKYANEAYEQIVNNGKTPVTVTKTIDMTLSGLDSFESGTVITATPTVTSNTGVRYEKIVDSDNAGKYTEYIIP